VRSLVLNEPDGQLQNDRIIDEQSQNGKIHSESPNVSRHETRLPNDGFEPAIKILRQRKRNNGKIEYLVLFENKESYWCTKDNVTEALIRDYHLRKRRRKRKH